MLKLLDPLDLLVTLSQGRTRTSRKELPGQVFKLGMLSLRLWPVEAFDTSPQREMTGQLAAYLTLSQVTLTRPRTLADLGPETKGSNLAFMFKPVFRGVTVLGEPKHFFDQRQEMIPFSLNRNTGVTEDV